MMGMELLKDFGRSLTGNIETAYLVVHDFRKMQAGKVGGNINAATQGALAGGVNSLVKDVLGGPEKMFQVQFNPKELQIYATSLPVNKADAQKTGDFRRNLNNSVLKPTVELTVNLLFDQVNLHDSFMMQKFASGVSATTLTNVASMAFDAAGGKTWSVQPHVEGLISALRNQNTRNITFQWTDFSFTGQISNIAARYTMFSVSGRPVRAQVTMRIRQKMDPAILQKWYDDFDTAFSGDSKNLVRIGQNAGNLVGGI